eukprot:10113896-Alexandrium_andersonii.AAC.1
MEDWPMLRLTPNCYDVADLLVMGTAGQDGNALWGGRAQTEEEALMSSALGLRGGGALASTCSV